jgi:xylulokinase
MSLLGIDIGTTGTKGAVFSADGRMLASAGRIYPLIVPDFSSCELDTGAVLAAVEEVIRECASGARSDPVRALGISTMGDSLTLIDEAGRPLSHTVVGAADRRAAAQAGELEKRFGRENLFRRTGAVPGAFTAIAKILWFKENRPSLYKAAAYFTGLQELVHLRLGVEPAMDYSLASRTMLMDISAKDLAAPLFREIGLEKDRFFPVAEASSVRGTVSPKSAERLGLDRETVVVAGGFDQCCAAAGSGCLSPGVTALGMGTLEAIVPYLEHAVFDSALLEGHHGCNLHVLPGGYSTLGYVTSSGGALAWFDRKFLRGSGDIYREEYLESVLSGASDIRFYPYVTGSGTPWIDENRTASVYGLTLETGIDDMARALLEGLAFEVGTNVEDFRSAGVEVSVLKASGGGARSDRLLQLRADVTGLPVERVPVTEAGCLGAAFVAGLGTGIFSSAEDIEGFVRPGRVFEPRTHYTERYEAAYRGYLEGRS